MTPSTNTNLAGLTDQQLAEFESAVRDVRGRWPDFHLHSRSDLSFAADVAYEVRFEARASIPAALRPAV